MMPNDAHTTFIPRWVCTDHGLQDIQAAAACVVVGEPIKNAAAYRFLTDMVSVRASLAALQSDADAHPELDISGPCMDIANASPTQLAGLFENVPSNYLGVKLGPAAALVCVSRGTSQSISQEFIGVSCIGVQASYRRQGHMLALLNCIDAAAEMMGRVVCLTEVHSERLQQILRKHPETWQPISQFGDSIPTNALNFVKIRHKE